jgi:hypothetical protein
MKKMYLTIVFFTGAILLATFQLIKFNNVIAHTSGWTDGQADSWTVFSSAADSMILLVFITLVSAGTYTGLSLVSHRKLRLLMTVSAALVAWLIFYVVQLAIQQHLSHFNGV